MTEKQTYEEGLRDGYNYAIEQIFKALGVQAVEEQKEDDSKFLNKPKK